jgi:hypothetical protein
MRRKARRSNSGCASLTRAPPRLRTLDKITATFQVARAFVGFYQAPKSDSVILSSVLKFAIGGFGSGNASIAFFMPAAERQAAKANAKQDEIISLLEEQADKKEDKPEKKPD